MSPEFLKGAERFQSSPDPDEATAQIVHKMCELARSSAADRLLRSCAFDAVRRFRGGPFYQGRHPFRDKLAIAESCYWWAKHELKFIHHSRLIDIWLNERDQLQLLISPDVLVRMDQMFGDCAIYSMLLCAFLDVLNVPWELVTLAVNPQQPDIFSHVYPRAVLQNGRRLALDASHGRFPGWSVPAKDIFRSQVWNQAGEPVEDSMQRFQGLHDYVPSHGLLGWAGMGQTENGTVDAGSDYGTTYTGTTEPITGWGPTALGPNIPSTIDTSGMTPTEISDLNALYAPGGTSLSSQTSAQPTGIIPIPSPSNANYSAVVAALVRGGMSLATIQSLPAGSYYNTATGQIVTGTGTAAAASLANLTPQSMLMWGALALGLVLLVSAMKR
jgi:hypothetical protein